MNRTLVALWTIIIAAIVSLVALVSLYNHQRQTEARLGLQTLLRQQLEPYNQDLADVFAEYQRELSSQLVGFDPRTPSAMTDLERSSLVGIVVVVSDEGARGQLLYPSLEHARPEDRSLIVDAVTWLRDSNFTQRSFLNNQPVQVTDAATANQPQQVTRQAMPQPAAQRGYVEPEATQSASPAPTQRSWLPMKLQRRLATSSLSTPQTSGQYAPASNNSFNTGLVADSHWTTWYHGRGMVLSYWTQTPGDTLTMVIVPRGRWLADVISALPDNSQARQDDNFQLIDVEGNVMTQWGNLGLAKSHVEFVELPVGDPLEGWRLRLNMSDQACALALQTDSGWMAILGAVAASSTLVLLGIIITLNLNRQLRLAAQQVSFVNQVSHELRTPLTNIRMYTDLALQSLQSHALEENQPDVHRLSIIQQENSRLGRLIENVLSFARTGRAQGSLKLAKVDSVDALIDSIVETFNPQMQDLKVSIQRNPGASLAVEMDREVFEQILVNLISNALKYAASGEIVRIESTVNGDRLSVRVIDFGPGIPKRMHHRIFQPFVRLRNRLEDPAGTGIGLTIARQLARQHGGDCVMTPNLPTGCAFEFTVKVTRA